MLGLIFLVIATLLLYRGAQINTGVFPYAHGAFASQIVGHWLAPLGYGVNSVLEVVFLLGAGRGRPGVPGVLGVLQAPAHLPGPGERAVLPPAGRAGRAASRCGRGGKVLDFEEADPDTDVFGLGKIEDFTWKGLLDMATCTECGRCQSQCPAWATGKPLSPKQVILDLRDHAFAKAPYLLAASDEEREKLPDAVKAEAERPLVGDRGCARGDRPGRAVVVHELRGVRGGVPGRHRAHRPHRRDAAAPGADRVRVPGGGGRDAEEPGEQGRPVGDGRGPAGRLDRRARLRGARRRRARSARDVEYLFWVGCAGALEDRAKKTTKAIASLLHTAGVKFAVLGPGRDLHRRPGPADRATSSCSRCWPSRTSRR